MSSVAGYRGLPNSSGYGPSKAALINLAESLYFDFKRYDVRISLITPGFIKTPSLAKILSNPKKPEATTFHFRNQYNSIPDTKISFNDIVVKAVALSLKTHPQVNSKWEDHLTIMDNMRQSIGLEAIGQRNPLIQ